jgi:hypothetical protein
MPKKLQIKLLSQSAELLSMTNCSVGQVSVLRSESPSELRPYQRALGGNQGKERFVITVDGKEYNTEEHNLIGFGEVAPHAGLTVGQYLTAHGLIEGAISGLLMAYGIEGIETKLCSSLSPDEERKVRLFAATAEPSKALIINEPFEPISSSWRERVAELLTDFARTKNGLVVIASLSYRPDAWIDNPVIARHQVGQSLRRTIGFGSAGSESTQLINQLRDQIRNEDANSAPAAPPPPPPREERPQAAAMSLGAAAMGSINTGETAEIEEELPAELEPTTSSGLFTAIKVGTVLGAGGLGVWAAMTLIQIYPIPQKNVVKERPAVTQASSSTKSDLKTSSSPSDETLHPAADGASAKGVANSKPKDSFVLDKYPEAIRVSILDTSRGIMGDPSQMAAEPSPQVANQNPADQSGNFYKLLESAGSDKNEGGAPAPSEWESPDSSNTWNAPESSEPVEYNASEEEERREAIRQKFLEAIRAAAERREQEGMDQ